MKYFKFIHMKRYILIFLILLAATKAMAQSHVSDLVVTPASGGTIKWYNASTGGTQYTDPANTALVSGTTYYASQTVNGVESTDRKAVTANLTSVSAPTAGTHTATATSVTWNWNAASGATGYKWNTANNYGTATDIANTTTVAQNSLTCSTSYTIYVWAYDATGCNSNSVSLSKTTTSCLFTGNLAGYRGSQGSTIEFLVTGSTTGSSWGGCGTDYIDQTDLQTAAVHSGYVTNGETKYVSVLLTAAQSNYTGCTLNGVVSANWAAPWGGSYRITGSRVP
jgi:hypothetical protein